MVQYSNKNLEEFRAWLLEHYELFNLSAVEVCCWLPAKSLYKDLNGYQVLPANSWVRVMRFFESVNRVRPMLLMPNNYYVQDTRLHYERKGVRSKVKSSYQLIFDY